MHKTLAELVEAFVLCIGDAGNYLHFDKLSGRNFSFVQLLHNFEKDDEMIAFATIPHILRRFDRRLAIIKGNQLEKRYLREWLKAFRIDRNIDKGFLKLN